jgi:hypothetical protein
MYRTFLWRLRRFGNGYTLDFLDTVCFHKDTSFLYGWRKYPNEHLRTYFPSQPPLQFVVVGVQGGVTVLVVVRGGNVVVTVSVKVVDIGGGVAVTT